MRVRLEIVGTIEIDENDYKPEQFGYEDGTPFEGDVLREILQEEYENGDLYPVFETSTFNFAAVVLEGPPKSEEQTEGEPHFPEGGYDAEEVYVSTHEEPSSE